MQVFILEYPGDAPCEVLKMTPEEFLVIYGDDRRVEIYDGDGIVETISIPPSLILCDLCNADISSASVITVVRGSKAYCTECADAFQKYLKDTGLTKEVVPKT